jgi:hypothetical protein
VGGDARTLEVGRRVSDLRLPAACKGGERTSISMSLTAPDDASLPPS